MVRRKNEYPVTTIENMRGGEGRVTLEEILSPEELYNKGRLFSKLTFPPGGSIGYHVHEQEMEAFYILSGTGEFDDNGSKVVLQPGDAIYTPDGYGHCIKNIGDTDLEILALILFH